MLYHDTDSLIYVSRPGDIDLPLSPYLGGLTSELEAGEFTTEWTSSGPKSYAYQTNKGKVVVKTKGIALTLENQERVNFDSLRRIVQAYVANPCEPLHLSTTSRLITRQKRGFHLVNKVMEKRLKVVYDKRVLQKEGFSLPFGY